MRKIEKDLSEEFNLSREEIRTIVNFSYAELKRQMYSDGLEYEVSGLGVFSVRHSRILQKELKNRSTFNERKPNSPLTFEESILTIEMKLENKLKKEALKPKYKA